VLHAGFSDGEPQAPRRGQLPRATALLLELRGAEVSWKVLDLSMQPSR
jgi:hypothetical protein